MASSPQKVMRRTSSYLNAVLRSSSTKQYSSCSSASLLNYVGDKDGSVRSKNHAVTPIRCKSSSSFASFVDDLPSSIRDSMKTTILDNVTNKDSPLWRNGAKGKNGVGHNGSHDHAHNNYINGHINDSIDNDDNDDLLLDDEWHIDEAARFYPDFPEGANIQFGKDVANPFVLARSELDKLSQAIREDLLGNNHPVLSKAASYFFEESAAHQQGKRLRPLIVFLLSRALSDTTVVNMQGGVENQARQQLQEQQDFFSQPLEWQRPDLPQAQRRLGEIAEMIHTASLVHDDVIDEADTRRGIPAVHQVFGNKVAILSGDYLLARASIYLARLRHVGVVESMSTIVEHLCRGEVMQIRGLGRSSSPSSTGTQQQQENNERLIYYLQKNFYKTGSLMANSCKSAALLGDYPAHLVHAAYQYGKHIGIAFQLVDDVLDFEGSATLLGKPKMSDLKSGLSTAPVLFASQEHPELIPMMERKFRETNDVDAAYDIVINKSNGIERTKELARVHTECAMEIILQHFHPGSVYRDSLIHLAYAIVERTK